MPYEDDNFINVDNSVWNYSLFTADDIVLFHEGRLHIAHEKFGSHPIALLGTNGCYFAVWAPAAHYVSVVGDFNGWKARLNKLHLRDDGSGIWEGFIPEVGKDFVYKYFVEGADGYQRHKADPYARFHELRPASASIVYDHVYKWEDERWLKKRNRHNGLNAPWSIYEVHLGSWMIPDKSNPNGYTSYLDLIPRLVPYVKGMGFTHVELMPVMEHPFDGSWGYQTTGYFAATSRFGKPDELKQLIDVFHQNGIGVILDWVPSHFPADEHGLYKFDGTSLYEYADPRIGYHPDWNSYIFDYSKGEVISFLLSSAYYWFSEFHADGIRVDAVNSIMRLDFGRVGGVWLPNKDGGNENYEASAFLRRLNTMLYENFDGIQTIAEDASDWPGITTPVEEGGYGFGLKWMIGWMNDIFRYYKKTPVLRTRYQNDLTFSMMYFYNEKFILPFSHDEVVHGKSPVIYKSPGNEWEQFANMRMLYGLMYMHPGGKLLFMGDEIAQTSEWNYDQEVNWELLKHHPHNAMQEYVRALNKLLRNHAALYRLQFEKNGFEWHNIEHPEKGIVSFYRKTALKKDTLLVVLNVTNMPQESWMMETDLKTSWKEIMNSDDPRFFGSGRYLNKTLDIIKGEEGLSKFSLKIGPFSMIVLK